MYKGMSTSELNDFLDKSQERFEREVGFLSSSVAQVAEELEKFAMENPDKAINYVQTGDIFDEPEVEVTVTKWHRRLFWKTAARAPRLHKFLFSDPVGGYNWFQRWLRRKL